MNMKKGMMKMDSASAIIKNTVSINQFNRGFAGRIFEDVKKTGTKVVIKNNQPECVLISPAEYIDLIDEINDLRLLKLSEERMAHYNPSQTFSTADLENEFGITQEDYDRIGEVEIE